MRLSACGTRSPRWYNGAKAKGTSRGPEDMPVEEMMTMKGFLVGLRSERAAMMLRVALAQMVVSGIVRPMGIPGEGYVSLDPRGRE